MKPKKIAWENAIEEGLVEDSNKDDFDLEIVSDCALKVKFMKM